MDDLESARLKIYALEDGAVRAQALAFSLHAGVFERLAQGPQTFDELCAGLGLSRRIAPTLIAFLSSQGLIARDGQGRLVNTEAASEFLVRSSPSYVGARGLLFEGFLPAIAHLQESLRTGLPWTGRGQHDMFAGFDEDEQRWFAEGMYANAVHGARALLRAVDFSPFRRLLDVGGNSGGYAIRILEAYPQLEGTIFDLPAVERIAEERIRASGLGGRLRFVAGSFFDAALPPGHDVVLLSSILHDWSDDDCARILRGCFDALEPGGTIIVTEPMLDDDYRGPDHPSVSGLLMAVLGGENRTRTQIAAMLEAAGFVDPWKGPLGPQNSTVTARKPSAPAADDRSMDVGDEQRQDEVRGS